MLFFLLIITNSALSVHLQPALLSERVTSACKPKPSILSIFHIRISKYIKGCHMLSKTLRMISRLSHTEQNRCDNLFMSWHRPVQQIQLPILALLNRISG